MFDITHAFTNSANAETAEFDAPHFTTAPLTKTQNLVAELPAPVKQASEWFRQIVEGKPQVEVGAANAATPQSTASKTAPQPPPFAPLRQIHIGVDEGLGRTRVDSIPLYRHPSESFQSAPGGFFVLDGSHWPHPVNAVTEDEAAEAVVRRYEQGQLPKGVARPVQRWVPELQHTGAQILRPTMHHSEFDAELYYAYLSQSGRLGVFSNLQSLIPDGASDSFAEALMALLKSHRDAKVNRALFELTNVPATLGPQLAGKVGGSLRAVVTGTPSHPSPVRPITTTAIDDHGKISTVEVLPPRVGESTAPPPRSAIVPSSRRNTPITASAKPTPADAAPANAKAPSPVRLEISAQIGVDLSSIHPYPIANPVRPTPGNTPPAAIQSIHRTPHPQGSLANGNHSAHQPSKSRFYPGSPGAPKPISILFREPRTAFQEHLLNDADFSDLLIRLDQDSWTVSMDTHLKTGFHIDRPGRHLTLPMRPASAEQSIESMMTSLQSDLRAALSQETTRQPISPAKTRTPILPRAKAHPEVVESLLQADDIQGLLGDIDFWPSLKADEKRLALQQLVKLLHTEPAAPPSSLTPVAKQAKINDIKAATTLEDWAEYAAQLDDGTALATHATAFYDRLRYFVKTSGLSYGEVAALLTEAKPFPVALSDYNVKWWSLTLAQRTPVPGLILAPVEPDHPSLWRYILPSGRGGMPLLYLKNPITSYSLDNLSNAENIGRSLADKDLVVFGLGSSTGIMHVGTLEHEFSKWNWDTWQPARTCWLSCHAGGAIAGDGPIDTVAMAGKPASFTPGFISAHAKTFGPQLGAIGPITASNRGYPKSMLSGNVATVRFEGNEWDIVADILSKKNARQLPIDYFDYNRLWPP